MKDSKTILELVKTPLSFMVFFLLLVESFFGFLITNNDDSSERAILIWSSILFFGVTLLAILLLAVIKPEALSGNKKWTERFAHKLITDIYDGLDGYLSNLPNDIEYKEAWLTTSDVLKNTYVEDKEFVVFCQTMSKELDKKTEIRKKWEKYSNT
ncbi:hypothetical protein [Cyclobacterium amurskyense]|uniref:hypothetical protein n=1 Tax=Cyclobacterium amurskyense TaxID=320787 RepID=UPI0030D96AE5|tara:strand:+ start:3429 stop:3893 length:465 start_codon:yes stop_codon:yes gene_type:complete